MKRFFLILILLNPFIFKLNAESLWNICKEQGITNDILGVEATWNDDSIILTTTQNSLAYKSKTGLKSGQPAWYGIKLENKNFSQINYICTEVQNRGNEPIEIMFWAVSSNGWGAVGQKKTIAPKETVVLKANLRETYPDQTPKVHPQKITQLRWMIDKPSLKQAIEIQDLYTEETLESWSTNKDMLEIPPLSEDRPKAGTRTLAKLNSSNHQNAYYQLYLPTNWEPNKHYPVIFEYPGNIFYHPEKCYSTGRPEDCAMGYGITKGKDSIWVSLPFINEHGIAMNAFGSNAGKDTTAYALEVIHEVCTKWGGDSDNLFLCGFSRGSIACGYIGLRNKTIAKHWKGIIGCQHYDGSKWNGSNLEGAVERAPNFLGLAIFQIDNSQEKYLTVAKATPSNATWTWAKSGLNFHATTMFLDHRPLMQQLRPWYSNLIQMKASN